jgi:hypothetical protein
MALYRFKVTFEDYDDVTREIDIKSNQTFEALHKAIHQSTSYDAERSSSFYISNDQWTKGEEITYLPNQKRIDRGISLMEKVKLSSFIDDPHQKFYYIYNFDRPYDFHVELMKIILDEDPKLTYPHIVRSVGDAPKQVVNIAVPTILPPTNEDFDFLNEMELVPEDTEDFSEVNDTGVDDEDETHGIDAEDHEEDEMDEFSDNEHLEDEGQGHGHDDY